MKILKLNKIHLISFLLFFNLYKIFAQVDAPTVDIESVRKDILLENKYLFPQRYIENMNVNLFNEFYMEDYCIVHIPYKNPEIHSSEKFSLVVIYKLQNNKWLFQKTIPYYFKINLIDREKKIFVSNNLFCGMDGSCNRFIEISRFNGDEFDPLAQFEGYDNVLYFERLLVIQRREEILNSLGETICSDIEISKIVTNDVGLDSAQISQKIIILKNMNSDTLELNRHKKSYWITYKP